NWDQVIKRMVRYGSRLPTDLQIKLKTILGQEYLRLNQDPSVLDDSPIFSKDLSRIEIVEWAVGDAMSQTHDMIVGQNQNVYVADNIQDRIFEVNPKTNMIEVHKVPHRPGEKNGGLIAARLKDFPKHESTSNAHSLALSKVD